jgi:hypothetical protein
MQESKQSLATDPDYTPIEVYPDPVNAELGDDVDLDVTLYVAPGGENYAFDVPMEVTGETNDVARTAVNPDDYLQGLNRKLKRKKKQTKARHQGSMKVKKSGPVRITFTVKKPDGTGAKSATLDIA